VVEGDARVLASLSLAAWFDPERFGAVRVLARVGGARPGGRCEQREVRMYYVEYETRIIRPYNETVYITRHPPRKNISGEPVERGWCGTTDGVSRTAHGAYATFEEAEAEVRRVFGRVRRRALEKVDGEIVYAAYRILPT
jgi:hypothetical protein